MRKKRANASERSAVERRSKKKCVLDEHDQDARPVSDAPPDDEEELVTSQNPSRRDIDEP